MGEPSLSDGSLVADRFEIERLAGKGGMSLVYRAHDRHSGQPVGLKVLNLPSENGSFAESQRFVREAQMLAELQHPAIVTHVAHGQMASGRHFLAMEWLDGEDLGQTLLRGPLPMADCLQVIDRVAEALGAAHQHGIIHRDIKPSNLFLVGGAFGAVKILDFGVARQGQQAGAMTQTGMIIGTPDYMAPEQARGSRVLTPAVDLFSLGCVLYECLTGQPPFVAQHVTATLVRILFEEPVPVEQRRMGVPPLLAALVKQLLIKDPTRRLADAALLRRELARVKGAPELNQVFPLVPVDKTPHGFANDEQSLFSIVLAAPAEQAPSFDATLLPASLMASDDRQALLAALEPLRVTAEYLASGALVVTVPQSDSAKDQVLRSARSAVLVKQHWPQAVVSIATGRGTSRGGSAVGEVVALAARSLTTSGRGEARGSAVFIDALSAKLLEGHFTPTVLPDGTRVLGTEKDSGSFRLLLGKATECVGRDAELSIMESLLASCIDESEARVMVVTAPPGIGKSRLRHEFLRRVEKRSETIMLLSGRGELASAGAPYGILRQVIQGLCGIGGGEPLVVKRELLRKGIARHLAPAEKERVVLFVGELCNVPFPDDGNPLLQAARQEPKIMRDCLHRALLDWLLAECAAAPVLLVVDDLQWGDELTVAVLGEALRAAEQCPLFILALARPELHTLYPKLWQRAKLQEVQLKALSKKACERLVAQVLGKETPPEILARAVEQSGGNALFLEELIRWVAEGHPGEQPDTVLAMLQARIGRLGPGAGRAVRAASVLGQLFWRGGVAAILSVPMTDPELEQQLTALVEAEFVRPYAKSRYPEDKEYGFGHALMREAAYGLLTADDLRTGHRLAGDFLCSAGERDAAVIAEHFARGGDQLRAAAFYLRAAEASLLRGDFLGALRLVDRGVACQPEGELLGQLRSLESYLALSLIQYERIGAATAVALAQLRPGSQAWCRSIVPACFDASSQQDAARGFQLVSQLLATEPDADARAAYICSLGDLLPLLVSSVPGPFLQTFMGRMAAVTTLAAEENPLIRRYLCSSRGMVAALREPAPWTVVQQCQLAATLLEQAGDTRLLPFVRSVVSEWGFLDLGDVEGAGQRLSALSGLMERSQDMNVVGLWRYLLARALCTSERTESWAAAEQVVAPMLNSPRGGMVFTLLAQGVMARLALLRGQLLEAEAQAERLLKFFAIRPIWIAHFIPVLIHAQLGLGKVAAATAAAERILAAIPGIGGLGAAEVEIRLAAAEAFHAAGDYQRSQTELGETLRQMQLRAENVTDATWKTSYLTRNPYCVRAQDLAKQWGLPFTAA